MTTEPDHGLQVIDFSRHQRWLNRAVGQPVAFLVFDSAGKPIFGEGDPDAAELGRAIVATRSCADSTQGDARPGYRHAPSSLLRLDINDDKTALYRSLDLTVSAPQCWAAVAMRHADYFGDNATALPVDQLAEAIDDVVADVAREYRQNGELDLMTKDLSECFEELHLVYAMDQHMQNVSGDSRLVFENLLLSTAEQLNVDVVAFVQPDLGICLHATALSREIHNLDLVLVEMRGDLYRFIQSTGEPVVMNAADDLRRPYIFTDMPYKILACPVNREPKIDSLIVLLNHAHKPDFTNSDRKLADVLAHQMSSVCKTQQLLKCMGQFNSQMAAALIEAVEAKDPYTRGHSERVHDLSMTIGKALGLPPEELDNLHWGSLLHDVGKIGIPDAVLCKPSRLSQDEYAFIMVHPERSYEILRHIEQLKDAVPGARHHQEMYDGTGYPHRLKGERIPLHARIIAVADTYDSITSSRAYRSGRSHEVAMAEIDRVSGKQLDPSIVAVFKELCAAEPEWLVRFGIQRSSGG